MSEKDENIITRDEIKNISKDITELKEQFYSNLESISKSCYVFNDTVDRLCLTLEKIDKNKTTQTIAFFALVALLIICIAIVILFPIG